MKRQKKIFNLDSWEREVGVDHFLDKHKSMRRQSIQHDIKLDESTLALHGRFNFRAAIADYGVVEDSYLLTIKIPISFPNKLPQVFLDEIGRDKIGHVNSDNSLCLTTGLRQKLILSIVPKGESILGFYVDRLLVPFLVANSCGECIYGEYPHGYLGNVYAYKELFEQETGKSPSNKELLGMLILLGQKSLKNAYLCRCPLHSYSHSVNKCPQAKFFFNKISPLFSVKEWLYERNCVKKGLDEMQRNP